jgi:hypothetical protein
MSVDLEARSRLGFLGHLGVLLDVPPALNGEGVAGTAGLSHHGIFHAVRDGAHRQQAVV